MQHVTPNLCAALFAGELSVPQRLALLRHCEACATCQAELAREAALEVGLWQVAPRVRRRAFLRSLKQGGTHAVASAAAACLVLLHVSADVASSPVRSPSFTEVPIVCVARDAPASFPDDEPAWCDDPTEDLACTEDVRTNEAN